MRKKVCFLLIFALIMTLNGPVFALDNSCLSEMSDEECLAFLESNGIDIPGTYNDSMSWVPFIRAIIERVEENPSAQFSFGYDVALMFAYEIKMAVNEYYGVNDISTYSLRSSSILQDNTLYGTWTSEYNNYNCYAYAIDYYEYEEKTFPGLIDWVGKGNSESAFWYNWNANAYTVAGWVKDDLESIGYTNVVLTNTIPTTQVSDHTKVICVRVDTDGELYYGFRDFHLMKLGENGYWYHKPGRTNPLKYNHTPSNNRIWVAEGYNGTNYFRDETCTYDSDIWFIEYTTPHEWSYAYYGPGQHIKRCTICGLEQLGNCEIGTPSYLGMNSHQSTCDLCHGVQPAVACTYAYRSNGNNTHTRVCTQCGHSESGSSACLFNANNICRICGAPKNGAVINKQEEVTPE